MTAPTDASHVEKGKVPAPSDLSASYIQEQWMSDDQLTQVDFAAYWNDEEEERAKEWYVADNDFQKMESYLAESGLLEDLKRCLGAARHRLGRCIEGAGIDLAAGNLWASAYLSTHTDTELLYCLELSRHRLVKLGPVVLSHYGVPKDRVRLVTGSFYDLRLDDGGLDYALMAQALHHAAEPERLLTEVNRVLRPGGIVLVIGEHRVTYNYVRHAVKHLIANLVPEALQRMLLGRRLTSTSLIPDSKDLFPPDPVLGDHYYTHLEYRRMFSRCGFKYLRVRSVRPDFCSFLLIKKRNVHEPA